MTHKIRPEIAGHTAGISTFQTHPRNARRGDTDGIAESLNEHGQYKPIIVQDSTGYIVAGNHTWLAARSLGWTHIAAVRLDLTDDQAMRVLLRDNRASDLAAYDDHALAELLQDMEKTGTLTGTGYTEEDLAELLESLTQDADPGDDDDPEPPSARTGLIECPECHHIWRADNHGEPV